MQGQPEHSKTVPDSPEHDQKLADDLCQQRDSIADGLNVQIVEEVDQQLVGNLVRQRFQDLVDERQFFGQFRAGDARHLRQFAEGFRR